MQGDLSDKEVAKLLRKHPRTIQRRCQAGKFPGAYKAGRSWRIPRQTLREAKLGEALVRDAVERELRAATIACEQLRQELEALKAKPRPPFASAFEDGGRNWRAVHHQLDKLQEALRGLPELAGSVPGR